MIFVKRRAKSIQPMCFSDSNVLCSCCRKFPLFLDLFPVEGSFCYMMLQKLLQLPLCARYFLPLWCWLAVKGAIQGFKCRFHGDGSGTECFNLTVQCDMHMCTPPNLPWPNPERILYHCSGLLTCVSVEHLEKMVTPVISSIIANEESISTENEENGAWLL